MESIKHIPCASNRRLQYRRADQKQSQKRNSPRSILFHRLFKPTQQESDGGCLHECSRVKVMISDTCWQFAVTDVANRALIFCSDADKSNMPNLAFNRRIGWCWTNLSDTPISVSLPRRELYDKVERMS